MIVWLRQMGVLMGKEFGQLWRDHTLLVFIVYLFTINVVMAGNDASRDLKDARLLVYDGDQSEASRDLISRFHPPYFKFLGEVKNPAEGQQALQTGRTLLFIEIPQHFELDLLRQAKPVSIQELVDTSKSTTGYLAASYSGAIEAQFTADWVGKARHMPINPRIPTITNQARIWFNPRLDESWFSSLAEMLMMLTVCAMLLPASAMVREKERGTIEQLLVCPLSSLQITLAKAVSMTLVMLALIFVCVHWILEGKFHIVFHGSEALFFVMSAIFTLSTAGIGFLIATFSRNSAQSGMLVLLVAMPMILLSGTWTALESMPTVVQWLTNLSPLRHYIDIAYAIIFRGAGLEGIRVPLLWMAGLGIGLFALSLWRFKKQFE